MRIPRLYIEADLDQEGLLELPETARHYLSRVLRLPDGASCRVFDGAGKERWARFLRTGRQLGHLELGCIAAPPTTPELQLHLLQGIAKGDAMDFAIQKAVELGVSVVQPVLTERSYSGQGHRHLEKRQPHWQGIIQSACEQCGRNDLPRLGIPRPLPAVLKDLPREGLRFVATPGGVPVSQLASRPSVLHTVVVLVGPEGGLSAQETAQIQALEFIGLGLGPRILRTETAALAAITLLQSHYGDWNR